MAYIVLLNMKSVACALAAVVLSGCRVYSPANPENLEYRLGDVYLTRKPLLVESFQPGFPYIPERERHVTEPRELDEQPERYLKNPEQWPNIHGVIPAGTMVVISKVQGHFSGLNGNDWEAYGRFSKKPWEDLEMSLYLISGDNERKRYSNGCVNRQLLKLVKHGTANAEQAGRGDGDKPPN